MLVLDLLAFSGLIKISEREGVCECRVHLKPNNTVWSHMSSWRAMLWLCHLYLLPHLQDACYYHRVAEFLKVESAFSEVIDGQESVLNKQNFVDVGFLFVFNQGKAGSWKRVACVR